jgi:four helix bundle protein
MHWSDLEVWKKSHNLVLKIYKLTSSFPKTEMYALIDQLRRAAYSVPANIVEGQSRNTTKEYCSFLYNSRGSVEEV